MAGNSFPVTVGRVSQSRYSHYRSVTIAPIFRQSFSCSLLLDFIDKSVSCTGLSPTTKGISVDFFSSGYLDVSVPWFASCTYRFSTRYLGYPRWVPPFRDLRIKVCLPTPRSFSQATTSFSAYRDWETDRKSVV